jgi:hypothetical protein
MPSFPPLLSTGNPYVAQGVRRFYWATTVANPAAPTRAEMTASTDLSQNITAISGWAQEQGFADRSVLGSAIIGKIAATIKLSDSSLSFEAGANSVDARALFTLGAVGYMFVLNEGDIAGQKMNVFKAGVGAVSPQQQMGDTEAQVDVSFGLFSANLYVAIPANP